MLVEDPVFNGDKEKSLPYSIPAKDGISASLQQVSRNQNPVSLHYLHHNILKLDSDFKILVFIDSYTLTGYNFSFLILGYDQSI